MPQLDFANPLTTSQVVWGAIIFAVLYVLLSRIGLPKVGAVIEERARHIASDLETAQAVEGALRRGGEGGGRGDGARAGRGAGRDQCGAGCGEAGGRGADRGAERAAGEAVAGGRDADQCGALGGAARVARGGDRDGGHGDRPADRRAGRSGRGWTARSVPRWPRAGSAEGAAPCTTKRASSPNRANWVLIAFVLFFAIFGRKLWSALAAMLDDRGGQGARRTGRGRAAAPGGRGDAARGRDAAGRGAARGAGADRGRQGGSRPGRRRGGRGGRGLGAAARADGAWTGSRRPRRPRWTRCG